MTGVLLTGGTGFVGGHLRSALPSPVVLLGRTEPKLRSHERWSHMDLSERLEPEKLTGGTTLCHLAYSMRSGRRNLTYNWHLLDAVNAQSATKRVILMSSVSVYGRNTSPVIDEESPCYPVGEYAETKLACEALWWEGLREDCELTVLRPTEIVGAGGEGMCTLLNEAFQKPIVGTLKRSLLHSRSLHYVAVSNVVAAVVFCLMREQDAAREFFVVSDDHQPENESYAVMQDFVRKLSGKRPLPGPPLPWPLVRAIGKATGRPLGVEQVFDSRRIHDAGFEDAVPLSEEVRRMVRGE